jgi:hypothetical protein
VTRHIIDSPFGTIQGLSVASWLNPNWTPQREAELIEFYGGKDSSGWQHEVAGEHGKPSYGAFNIEQFNCASGCVRVPQDSHHDSELRDCDSEESSYDRLEMLLNLTPQTGMFWLGGDLGYTNDPTELVLFQEHEIGDRQVKRLVLRIHLEHVSYPIRPDHRSSRPILHSCRIGVDNGGTGCRWFRSC